jgi:hypothetical protein
VRDIDGQTIKPLTKAYNLPLHKALNALGLPAEISYYGDRLGIRVYDYKASFSYVLEDVIKKIAPNAEAIFTLWWGAFFYYIEVRE